MTASDSPHLSEPIATSVTGLLPQLHRCDEIPLAAGEVIIQAAGFEDRTMAAPERVAAAAGARAILLDYIPWSGPNRIDDVRAAYRARGVEVSADDVLKYDRFDPNEFEGVLSVRLRQCQAEHVIVDASTMSKLAIMLVLQVCRQMDLPTTLFYAEAAEYGPSESEFIQARKEGKIQRPSQAIYTGVHGVVGVESLASVAMQGQPTAAVTFMSLNNALTQVLLNSVFPARLLLINGRPPVHSWREEATAWIHDHVRREWSDDNPVTSGSTPTPMPTRVTSTLDYRETVTLLLELYWSMSASHRLLIAPTGSKMQAVACSIVKSLHPDIHIEYPCAEAFLPDYSRGVGPAWSVAFGRLPGKLRALAREEVRAYLAIPQPG